MLRQKLVINFIPGTETQTWLQLSHKKVGSHLFWPSTNKITGTQHHHKLIFHSSCHFQRALLDATKVEQRIISVGNKWLLVITGALITRKVTQRAMICHHWWYMCLLHWIIQSSIHLSYHWFVNSHPALQITLIVITIYLIARTITKRAIIFHHRQYLCLLHWMIKLLVHLICSWFVNSHPDLHRTELQSRKLLQ